MPMPPIQMRLTLFENKTQKEQDRSRTVLLWLLEALTRANQTLLSTYRLPKLYESKVRYVPEHGKEVWQDIPNIIKQTYGDCEDLAAWRTAELRQQGIPAKPHITWRPTPTGLMLHAVVALPDGRIEDPSEALGMGGVMYRRPVYRKPTGEISMAGYSGNFDLQRAKGGGYSAKLNMNTPRGPLDVNIRAPALGDLIMGMASPIEKHVNPDACKQAKRIFRALSNPKHKARAERRMQHLRERSKGDEQAIAILWAVSRLAHQEKVHRAANHDQAPVIVGVDAHTLYANLDQLGARGDKAAKKAKALFKAQRSTDTKKSALAKKLEANTRARAAKGDKHADRCIWALKKYRQAVAAREAELAGETVILGFGWGDIKRGMSKLKKAAKKVGKKTRNLEKQFRAAVTKNKKLVAMIPVYGPMVVAGAELLNRVDNADPDAIAAIQAIKTAAELGDVEAGQAMQTLAMAQGMRSSIAEEAAMALKRSAPELQTQAKKNVASLFADIAREQGDPGMAALTKLWAPEGVAVKLPSYCPAH